MKLYWTCGDCHKEYLSNEIEEIHFNFNEFEPAMDAKAICKKCVKERDG